jgi:hypothetical protein
MADSCRTSRKGRKGRTKSDDATLSRGSSAKASATVRALRNPPGRRPQPEVVMLLLISGGRALPGPPSPLAESAPGSGRDSLKTWLFNPGGLAAP